MIKKSTKLTCSRTIRFIGRHSNSNNIITIPNVLCFRKGMTKKIAKIASSGYKEIVGLVSSVGAYRSKSSKLCKFWCHCFKSPEACIKDKPGMLLSESDFIDPAFIRISKRRTRPTWDFFYFTSGGKHARKFKGSDVFGRSLDILCGEFKLRGLIIKYMKHKRSFLSPEKEIIKKYAGLITIRKGLQKAKTVAAIMSRSKFGFFPNTLDCSPLMISESLVRNCPILVNKDIFGGWKYVNEKTGCLFDPKSDDDLGASVESVLSSKFCPKKEYMSKYGYINTAQRFASVAGRYIKGFSGFSLIGLNGTGNEMRALSK